MGTRDRLTDRPIATTIQHRNHRQPRRPAAHLTARRNQTPRRRTHPRSANPRPITRTRPDHGNHHHQQHVRAQLGLARTALGPLNGQAARRMGRRHLSRCPLHRPRTTNHRPHHQHTMGPAATMPCTRLCALLHQGPPPPPMVRTPLRQPRTRRTSHPTPPQRIKARDFKIAMLGCSPQYLAARWRIEPPVEAGLN